MAIPSLYLASSRAVNAATG